MLSSRTIKLNKYLYRKKTVVPQVHCLLWHVLQQLPAICYLNTVFFF